MKERPILMNGAMVRAILDDSKTHTRRMLNPQPSEAWRPHSWGEVHRIVNGEPDPDKIAGWGPCDENGYEAHPTRHGKPGDRLYARETWQQWESIGDDMKPAALVYRATDDIEWIKWRPAIHMPRWASRITLEITGIRVERLQDISEEDAMREGISIAEIGWKNYLNPDEICETPIQCFQTLWESINGPGSWARDGKKWVWVIEFKRIKP